MPFVLKFKKPYAPVVCSRALKAQVSQNSACSRQQYARCDKSQAHVWGPQLHTALGSIDVCDMATVLDLEVDAEDVFKLLDPRDQNLMLDHLVTLGSKRPGKKAEKPES